MTMVKLGPGAVDINGKLGGGIWRGDQCRKHVQKPPKKPAKPSDPTKRTKQQKCFSKALYLYKKWTPLGPGWTEAWWRWAADHPIKNKKGETVYLNPFTAFMSYNIQKCLADKPMDLFPLEHIPG